MLHPTPNSPTCSKLGCNFLLFVVYELEGLFQGIYLLVLILIILRIVLWTI
jgi:hypothetical protein